LWFCLIEKNHVSPLHRCVLGPVAVCNLASEHGQNTEIRKHQAYCSSVLFWLTLLQVTLSCVSFFNGLFSLIYVFRILFDALWTLEFNQAVLIFFLWDFDRRMFFGFVCCSWPTHSHTVIWHKHLTGRDSFNKDYVVLVLWPTYMFQNSHFTGTTYLSFK
jgi:hypothetical protein